MQALFFAGRERSRKSARALRGHAYPVARGRIEGYNRRQTKPEERHLCSMTNSA